jgi:hypothetical protein
LLSNYLEYLYVPSNIEVVFSKQASSLTTEVFNNLLTRKSFITIMVHAFICMSS